MKCMSPLITSVFLLHISDDKLYGSCHDEIALSASCHDKTDNGPIFTGSYKVKVCSRLCILLFYFPLARTSVYSNIIFCEVSRGEKQFGHPHCNLIRTLCWMQQTPRVTVLSILETPDIYLIFSPFYLQASLITPFFFSSSPPFSDRGCNWLPFPLALPTTVCLTSLFCRILWLSSDFLTSF